MEGDLFVTLNVCLELVLYFPEPLSPQADQCGLLQDTTTPASSASFMVPEPNPTMT